MLFASDAQTISIGDLSSPTAPLSIVDGPLATLADPLTHLLLPRVTPPPACCSTNQVLVELSTSLIIKDYRRFYSTDIHSFRPTYLALDDGSLITPALINDLWNSNLDLLFVAALATLFLRNIVAAVDYLRRGKMKNKTLYYLLLASQALAPASFVPLLVSTFNQNINCTLAMLLSSMVGSVALALLLSGIMGIKTFKCMNDSKIVAGIIAILELGHMAFVIWDAITIRGVRRLTGTCLRASELRFTRISVAIQMSSCCFMTLCFLYTYIKYRKTPGARGRISLRMSMEEPPNETGLGNAVDKGLATNDISHAPARPLALTEPPVSHLDDSRSHAHKSIASSFSRLSKLFSNMVNLRRVMRDELLYCCVVTVVFTSALIVTFTVNVNSGLSITSWIMFTWGLVSTFVIHSCGRVIRRHEREAIIRYTTSKATSNGFLGAPKVDYDKEINPWVTANSPKIADRRVSLLIQTGDFADPFSEGHSLPLNIRPSSQIAPSSSLSLNFPPPLDVADPQVRVVLPSSPLESSYQPSGRS
ncbi:hypothetical protein Agabi119p4_603 [Agaricus bisporus var. burnettii]|uniref:Uncharacterized protein n=1 Tax=Agaricus bisporus var. burnettii TaxID=192524 RepID=A0A8H7FAX1_AGABI|nr:hypothetical protein Agabi119p4_603 [Agaricus bisporus var. burnettii]